MPLLDNEVVELRCHPVLRVCELGWLLAGVLLTASESSVQKALDASAA